MTLFQAVFLALIQGITEFLPVSSSGHLVIFQRLFGLEPPVMFDIMVHVGTLGAVVVFFRSKLKQLISGILKQDQFSLRLFLSLFLASLPALFAGLILNSYLEEIFSSLILVGVGLLITAILLFSSKKRGLVKYEKNNWEKSLWIGLAQALAIIPGISRSGSTISIGLAEKLRPDKAFEFSFLLSIPAILGALSLQFIQAEIRTDYYFQEGLVGMVVAGVVGFFALRVLKKSLTSNRFWLFGIYCFSLGLLLLLVFN